MDLDRRKSDLPDHRNERRVTSRKAIRIDDRAGKALIVRLQKTVNDLGFAAATQLLEAMPQSNTRLVDELTAQFARTGGGTLWDFHQVLTSWSTHDIPARTKADRQKRVTDLVEGRDWLELERV